MGFELLLLSQRYRVSHAKTTDFICESISKVPYVVALVDLPVFLLNRCPHIPLLAVCLERQPEERPVWRAEK